MLRTHIRKKSRISFCDSLTAAIFLIVTLIYALHGGSTSATDDTKSSDSNLQMIQTATENAAAADSFPKTVVSEPAAPDTPVDDALLERSSTETVRLLTGSGTIANIPLETYVAHVVASEMPSNFDYEALKAQAVAARTYVIAGKAKYENGTSKHPNAYVCSSTCCQVYQDEAALRKAKGDTWYENDFNRIKNAVVETAGECLYYQGALVEQPLFFSSAGGGRTENSEDVFTGTLPYLRSVSSSYDSSDLHKNDVVTFSYEEVMQKVHQYAAANAGATALITDVSAAPGVSGAIQVLSRTEGGGAAQISFDGIVLSGRQTRSLFGLTSSDITISADGTNVLFTTRGSGHRVGMSQYGADGMGKSGYDYRQILNHYYSGTTVA